MENNHASGDATTVLQPRLIPHVVSEHATTTPQKIWGSIPVSLSDASDGYEDITFARLNYAITRTAEWMKKAIEPQRSRSFETLAYIGPPDTRYIIFTIAAVKVGFQMLFLSPRNSNEAQQSVIQQAKCGKFLCSSSLAARIEELLQSSPGLSTMTLFIVPEQEDLLKDEFVPDFPYERTVEAARSEPLVVLHTSSTTGIPKTVQLNQGYGLHEDVVRSVPKFEDLDIITRKPFYGQCRMFVAMPLFHAGGVLLTLLKSIYHDIVSVFQPPSAPLDSRVFDSILRHGKCNGCVIPPFLLEDMLTEPSYFDTLASLKFVQFGSGPLSKAAGDLLLTRQKNCPHYIGSSECGLFLLLELDDPVKDWQYFRFHPWSGVDLRPIGDDSDTRELFIVRAHAPKIPGLQPVFELFPDLSEWPTRDLYVRHPTKPDHWRCIGRNDDVLVLSNGEKLNPVDTEGRIANAHASVTGALVIGQGQFAPGLLLEVRDVDLLDASKRSQLIEEIWPSIQAANREAPGHGQLTRSLVLFTSPGKPFLRTPKLSIRRKPTIDLYTTEIEEMYKHYTDGAEDSENGCLPAVDLSSIDSIRSFLLGAVHSITEWEPKPRIEDDLFMYGMDSLQVVRIARVVKSALERQSIHVDFNPRTIYSHPTMSNLSEAIFQQTSPALATSGDVQSPREDSIERIIRQYSTFESLPTFQNGHVAGTRAERSRPLNVILTGSTGSLGSYILSALLENARVANIYCLNRSEAARERQISFMAAQGADISMIPEFDRRVHFLHTSSLGSPQLGIIDHPSYLSLQNSMITHVIHNAWPVNFNLTLHSFTSHVAGVRALIDFCANIPQMPRILFVSSLSSITALSLRKCVPETVTFDHSAPAHMGYGESKYAAERILDKATEASHGAISTTILRIGQIAGPVKGSGAVWPAREWLPSLLISSKTVGALPDSLGRMNTVDWVPVDLLADCVVELLEVNESRYDELATPDAKHSKVLHVVNPNVISWSDLLPTVSTQLGVMRIVSLKDWVELVRAGPPESSTSRPNPAKKILPFYESIGLGSETRSEHERSIDSSPSQQGRYEVGNMAQVSNTFRVMGPVTKEWMSKWTAELV